MSSPHLNLTSLAVLPKDGQFHRVLNVGTQNHCFDNAFWNTANGNPVLSWACQNGTNENWSFRTYPSCNNETVFTLQVQNVMQNNSAAAGGYLRADQGTNKLVIGQPQAWKLIQVSPLIYKIAPFDSFLYGNGSFVVTDVREKTEGPTWQLNQMHLQKDTAAPEQLWMFH